MDQLVYILALFGCTDDAATCEPLYEDPPRFASRVACELAADKAIVSDLALRSDHPTVTARCIPQGAKSARRADGAPALAQAASDQPRPR